VEGMIVWVICPLIGCGIVRLFLELETLKTKIAQQSEEEKKNIE